jgi:signal transduction histidine kinase
MPDAVRADVVGLGHRALGRLGARVGWLYLASAACALVVGGWSTTASAAGDSDALLATLAAAGLVACGAVLQRATRPAAGWDNSRWRAAPARVAGLLAVAAGTAAATAVGAHLDWYSTQYVGTVVATAGGTALALAAGPWWGAASCALSLAAMFAVVVPAGIEPAVVNAVGTAVSTSVAASAFLVMHRGFAETERALAGADAAALAHQVSRERWRTRRRTDRQLHDTVLTTLNLLVHQEFRTPPEVLRDLCRRDQQILEGGTDTPADGVTPGTPGTPPGGMTPGTPPTGVPSDASSDASSDAEGGPDGDAVAAALVRHWARSGLAVNLHGTTWHAATAELPAGTEQALYDAMGECLANVHEHAGVAEANVVVIREPGVVSVLVVDAGRGFDTTAVGEDRLGLAESVRGRLAEVAGDAVLWSSPGQGTSVLLSVPGPR